MKAFLKPAVVAIAAAFIASVSQGAFAAIATYTPLGDSGTLEVTTYSPTQIAATPLLSPYGAPVITPIASGWVLTFTPNSNFFAQANNLGGGKTAFMSGKLDFILSFDTPIKLTANIYEDGIFNTTGNGHVSVSGGSVIAEAVNPVPNEKILNGNLGAGATFNNLTGGWSTFLQVTGFQNAYTSYKLSVDNDLLAESLGNNVFGSAMIAKKDFTIIITTDGSSGSGPPVPEPASLGVMALGTLALLRRRRV